MGRKDDELLSHLIEMHHQLLWCIARFLPEELPEHDKMWATYSEAIAWQVRKGAPLATYAIDRRAMAGFTTRVEGMDIEEIVCCSCARRFARLGKGDSEEISWAAILSRSGIVGSQSEDVLCLGLTMEQTAWMFGLEDCNKNSLGLASVYLSLPLGRAVVKFCHVERFVIHKCLRGTVQWIYGEQSNGFTGVHAQVRGTRKWSARSEARS